MRHPCRAILCTAWMDHARPKVGWIRWTNRSIGPLAMPIDREVLEAVREMDEHELRRLFMLARARLESQGHSFPELGPGVKVRKQMVRCGKASCTQCPHGPYIYAYWMEDGKQKSKYLGREADMPEAVDQEESGS